MPSFRSQSDVAYNADSGRAGCAILPHGTILLYYGPRQASVTRVQGEMLTTERPERPLTRSFHDALRRHLRYQEKAMSVSLQDLQRVSESDAWLSSNACICNCFSFLFPLPNTGMLICAINCGGLVREPTSATDCRVERGEYTKGSSQHIVLQDNTQKFHLPRYSEVADGYRHGHVVAQ